MDTKTRLWVETDIGPTDHERVARQLRIAAADRRQSEAHRQRIRAATRC